LHARYACNARATWLEVVFVYGFAYRLSLHPGNVGMNGSDIFRLLSPVCDDALDVITRLVTSTIAQLASALASPFHRLLQAVGFDLIF